MGRSRNFTDGEAAQGEAAAGELPGKSARPDGMKFYGREEALLSLPPFSSLHGAVLAGARPAGSGCRPVLFDDEHLRRALGSLTMRLQRPSQMQSPTIGWQLPTSKGQR